MKSKTKLLLEEFFSTGKHILEKQNVNDLEILLEKEVLVNSESNDKLVKLNPYSTLLNETILEFCRNLIEFEKPKSVEEVSSTVKTFRIALKEQNEIRNHRPYSPVLEGFYAYLLSIIYEEGVDVYSYASDKIMTNDMDRLADDFDRAFVYHLFNENYSSEEVYKFCQACSESQNQYSYRQVYSELVKQKPTLLWELYELGRSDELEQCEFQLRLTPIVYDYYNTEVYENIIQSSQIPIENKLRVLVRCKLSNHQIAEVLNLLSNIAASDSSAHSLNDSCYSLIQNINATKKQKVEIYQIWGELLSKAEEGKLRQIINNISFIDDEEHEHLRFQYLIIYLSRTSEFSVLDSFFNQFKNPQFVYDLLVDHYRVLTGRKYHLAAKYKRPLEHFFRVNPEQSEKCILELFKVSHGLGTLPIDVIKLSFSKPFFVDLSQLQNEEDQLSAIPKFFYVSFDFEKVLPILMTLWNTKNPNVIDSLLSHLSALTYDSYGHDMVNWLKPLIKGKGSRKFLNSIREVADQREKDLDLKFSINDLNPYYQEKDLLVSYKIMASEKQSESMKEGRERPGFLASMMKSSTVVRGNSAKMGRKGKVIKMGAISVSSTLDSRLYKNPELFEFNLRNVR